MFKKYLKKEVKYDVDFLHADKSFLQAEFNTLGTKVSYKVILSLMDMIRHAQITQSNKFAISLQYLRKEVKNGVHFFACR